MSTKWYNPNIGGLLAIESTLAAGGAALGNGDVIRPCLLSSR